MNSRSRVRVNRHMPGGGEEFDGWISRSEAQRRQDLRYFPQLAGACYLEDAEGRRFALSLNDEMPWWLERTNS